METLNEYYLSTYNVKFSPKDFLDALNYYTKTLDDYDISIINKNSEYLNRLELMQINDFLKNHYNDIPLNNYRTSGPWIKPIFDSISTEKLDNETLSYLSSSFITNLIYIKHIAVHIMSIHAKYHIELSLKNLKLEEKISRLLDVKHQLKINTNAFPAKHIEEITAYLETSINYYKEKGDFNKADLYEDIAIIYKEKKDIIQHLLDSNELFEPLYNSNFVVFTSRLKDLFYIPSYYDIVDDDLERVFHIYCLAILVSSLKLYKVVSNKESGLGRFDIAINPLDTSKHCVIIEIKRNLVLPKDSDLNEAISQIISKNYDFEYRRDGFKKFLYIAIVFYKKEPFLKYQIIEEIEDNK